MCPFCCVILHNEDDIKTDNDDNCCDKKELLVDDYQMTCQNCATVDHFIYKNDYIDFYENMYKIRKKSVYIRNNYL